MKRLLTISLFIPLFLISCGKSEEVKTVVNLPVIEKQIIATGSVVEGNTGKVEEVSTGMILENRTESDSGLLTTDTGEVEKVVNSGVIKISTKAQVCSLSDGLYDNMADKYVSSPEKVYAYWKEGNILYFFTKKYRENSDWVEGTFLNKYDCSREAELLMTKENFGSGLYSGTEITHVTPKNIFIYEFVADSIGYSFGDNIIFNKETKDISKIDLSIYDNVYLLGKKDTSNKYPCGKFTPISDIQGILSCSSGGDFDNEKYLVDIEKKKILNKIIQ